MGQPESTLAANSVGYALPGVASSSSSQPPARRPRLDMRWSRLTMDQLRDEEFLTKQLRRMEVLTGAGARRHTTAASGTTTSASSAALSGRDAVFVNAMPSRSSLQQRIIYGKAGSPSPLDERGDEGGVTGIEGELSALTAKRTRGVDGSNDLESMKKEHDLLNALYLLGNVEQPELAALMLHKLQEALLRCCTFLDPYYELLALKRYILRSAYDAVQVQHQHQRALTCLAAATVESIQKGLVQIAPLSPLQPLNPTYVASARDKQTPSGVALGESTLPPIKPKEKVAREASMGIQVVFSLFASILDQASSSLTQKKEFLAELLPLIKSLPPQALAPTNCSLPSSSPGAAVERGLTATASAVTSDSRELVDRIQRFLLGVCPLPSLKPGPSSPKVHAVMSSLNDFDVTDRTNAVNGLIYLAAARSSLRDFLIAMKVILGALESCCDANDTHSTRLSSPLTTSAPLLKPKGEDQHPTNSVQSEWKKDEVASKYKSKMDISSLDLKPGAARQRGDILANGKGVEHEISHSTPHDLVIQVKRKALPKGFVPKAIGTTSTTTALNVSLAYHRPSGSQGAGVTNAAIGVYKSKMKEDLKALRQSGSTGFSLDISMMQDSGSRDAFVVATNHAQTVKCPKLKPLNISSVLHQLDGAKASMPPKPTRFPRGTQQSSSSIKYEDVCSTSGIVLGDGMMLPGQDDCEDKEVWSCGQNSYGELGHGDTITRKSFDRIEALQRKDVVQVSAGNEHSIVLCGDGTVLTCGYNDNGQCGVGVTNRVSNVTEIHKFGDHAISQVHAYNGCEHSVIVTQDGKAATFGYNYRGQLGHGNTTSENVPKLIRSLEGKIVRLVSCSYYHTILTCEDAGAGRQFVYTFGRNDYGQLGHNDTIDRKVPHHIDALAEQQIVSVACGQYHTMVVSSTGKAYGFGKNDYGQLGTESAENQLVPVQVRNGLEKQVCLEIRCGYYHTIVLCSGVHLYGFGRNDYGQLGLGKANATAAANLQLQQQRFASPQLIEELEGKEIIRFACGCYHTIAVSDNGVLFVFGRNNHGQLGTGDTNERLYPFPIEDFLGKRIAMVAAGFYHTVVLTGGKEEEKTDQDGEPGNMGDENVDENLRGPSVLCSSSILLTSSVRHILDTSKSALSSEVGGEKLEKERAADRMEDSEDPSCDHDDEDCRDEDDRRRKAGATVDNTPDLTDKSVQHGVDSVDAAVIIFAELDRLCKPFLPKTGSYPILQHPSNTAMEVFRSTIQASSSPNIDLCVLFDGCFEANVIHVCSSTFESLCTLLKHLSGRKIESLAYAQPHLQAASQNGVQLQVYILFVCLRLLQANLAQLLRSGLGKAAMLFTMGRDTAMEIYDQAYAVVQGDPRFTTLEVERMLAAIRQIRETLIALVDLKQRVSSFLSADTEANNGEIVAKIASDAVDTLMLGFELFFPCTCAQRQFFLHVIESRPEISKGDCACEGKVHFPTPGSHPKSRKLLLGPLLRRMAEDSLILKFLPLAARDPLLQADSSTKPNLSSISLIYTALLERIATEFIRALGEAADLQGGSSAMAADNSRHPPLTFEPSLFNLLLVLQKHIAAWASSRTRWERKAHGHTHQALSMVERVAMLTDHVIRVDAKEKDDIPLPWRCFIEFSLATMSQCCDVFRQVIFQESMPSPSFGHKYQDPSFAAGNEEIMIDNAFMEIVEASIVGQLLPSLVSSLLVFSSNPLFAATLFPSVKNLLRFLDDFNQHNQAIKGMENNRRGGHGGSVSAAGAQSNSMSGQRKQSGTLRLGFGRESELNASDVKRGSIGDVICLPWSFLLEKDLAVLAAEMAVTLKIGDPFFTFENSQATSVSRRWLTSPLFSGGLNVSILRRSIKQANNPQASISDMARIVQHMPFPTSSSGDATPFSLVLPPCRPSFSTSSTMWQHDRKCLSNTSKIEEYRSMFGEDSIRNFVYCLSGRLAADCCDKARLLCDWIRDHYAKSNGSYRMLVRQSRASTKSDSSVDIENHIEYAAFAAMLHHHQLSHLALHFAISQGKWNASKPPPCIFLILWHTVAELRRRFAAKKTEIKNSGSADPLLDVANMQQTIIDRCQLLLVVAIQDEEEHLQYCVDGGVVAAWDPAFCESGRKCVGFPGQSLRKHMRATYGACQLPFLSVFPESRWRKVRMLFHVIARWKWIGSVRHRAESLKSNGVSRELLDFITTDEPVSTDSAVSTLLIDPSRRASCASHGFKSLCELLSIPSFESIQTHIIHRISHILVFQSSCNVGSATRMTCGNTSLFYKETYNSAFSEFLTEVTQLIIEKSNALLSVSESESAVDCRPLIMMLSCWALHFQDDHFDFVNDVGILGLLQEILKCIERPRGSSLPMDNGGNDSSQSGNTRSFGQLTDMLWILIRYICVHLGAQQATRLDRSTDLRKQPMIDLLVEPALSDTFDRILGQTLELARSMLPSTGSMSSGVGKATTHTSRSTSGMPAVPTMRRSFEIILAPRRFSSMSKGLSFPYEEMISPSLSVLSAGARPAMSPLTKPNVFSITTWVYINHPQSSGTKLPASASLLSPRLADSRLIFLRGNSKEIAPYLILVPESDSTWHFEVGLVVSLKPESERAFTIGTSMSSKHILLERVTSKEPVRCGKWVHVAIVLEATKIRLYLNGILDNQRALATAHASALADASVDLPFHFGKCSSKVLSATEPSSSSTLSSVAASLRLLALSLGSTKRSSGYFGATDSDELSDKTLKSFEGILGHFRFHNRSLSPIHVRIVYDEKKQNGPTSVSTSRTVSPLTRIDAQERKMMDQLAVVLLLSASSEGLLHFTMHGSQWLKLLWEIFVKIDVFQVQQSVLRVLRAILPYQSPRVVSQVLTQDVDSLPMADEILMATLGFSSRDDVFIQQIIRIVGFTEFKYPLSDSDVISNEPDEQKYLMLPWALLIPAGVHGNEFSPACDDFRSVHWDLDDNVSTQQQVSAMQPLALGNELIELLHHLFSWQGGSLEWRDAIERSILCILSGENMRNACDFKRSSTLFRMGTHIVSRDIIKVIEGIACLRILSGLVDFTRPGATVMLAHTGEIAHVIGVEQTDSVPSPRSLVVEETELKHLTSKRTLAYLSSANHNTRTMLAGSSFQSAGGVQDGAWYDMVLRYSELHQQRRSINTQANNPEKVDPRPRYICLNVEDLQPVELVSTSKASSSFIPSIMYGSRNGSNDFQNLIVRQISDISLEPLDSINTVTKSFEDSKKSGHLHLMQLRSNSLLMKALLQAASSRASAHELLSKPVLMDRVVQLSVSDNGNSSFINVSQAERQVWLLRQRVYQVLVDLGDEGEHELQQILSATVSVTSSRQNARIAVQQLLEEDTECLVLSPESLCHAAEEPSSDMDSKLGTKRNSRHDLDSDGEDYEGESLADERAMRDSCSSDAKDDDDDVNEDDEDGEDEEAEEDEDEEDEDEEAEGNRAEFVEELMLMGFPEEWCVLALKQTENDIVCASAWIVDNLEYLSRLQSSLDKQRDRGRDTPRFNEEEDDNSIEDPPGLDAETNRTETRRSSCSGARDTSFEMKQDATNSLQGKAYQPNESERADLDSVAPPLNDREMARKVFGEMYFPFEDGGYQSNIRHCYMRSWRSEAVEMKLQSCSKPQTEEVSSLEEASSFNANVLLDESLYLSRIDRMDFHELVTTLRDLEQTLSVLYARQCMTTLCFHLSDQPHYSSAAIQFSVKYTQFFQLLKVVVHRGNQFKVIIQDDRVGHLQEKSPEDVLSSVIAFFLKHDFDAFLAAAFDFCLREIEEAASNKTYEAYLWTQRDLTRSDNVVLTEPGIELVSWVLDTLLTSKSTLSWKMPEAIILVLKRLRYTLKATNLPLKFLTLHAISTILQKISSAENSELAQRVIRDSKLVFSDFLNAAKQRHSRELVQNRLLFSLYLQAFIEILHVLRHIPCLNTKSTLRALPANPFVSLSPPLAKPHNKDNAARSLAFDRKRCRSNLLTISDDAISVGYSGNEVWKTVFATESFATGVISWEIQIEKSSSSYIFVGVANSRASCDSFLGADDHSWGYIGDKALYYQRNRVRAYGDNFGEGDCIGVQLDCERGTLSFSKNGVNLGVAFENIVGEVYPAVAFYSRHQRVSFVQDSLVVDQTKLDIPANATDGKLDESTTPGSIEESVIVCELMASMIDKQSVRQEPLRSAYEMTMQWISGSKKYVTTRAGKPLWVDITCDSCTPFGFQSGERVRTVRGNGVVVGVAEQRLWVDVDGEQGAWFFHPSKLRSLTLISVNNLSKVPSTTSGSFSSAQDTANGIVDPMIKKIPTKSVNEAHHLDSTISAKLTFEEFEAFVNDTRWSLVIDRELISLVNDFCETSSVSPWNVSPTEMLELFRLKANELETAIGSGMAFFTKPSQKTQLVARMGFLRFFNAYFSRVIGYFDLTWHYFSPDSSLLPCKLVSKCRGSIFIALKNDFFTALMEKTANSPKKADDDYDYPEDLPQVLINRPKAAAAKCHPGSTKSLFLSMFGQAFEELHFLPLKTLRMVYSHPMDDGQLRSFKVKFEGEGVDDYGGPYREFFSQFFAELQMLRSKNDLDPGAQQQQQQENTSPKGGSKLEENPTECLLPFLLPSPNWRNGVGANREKFVINAALLRDTPLARNGNQSRANGNNTMHEQNSSSESSDLGHETAIEKRQLHGEMLFFLGQMLGTCLRTRVCVRLDLAISVWKHLAGEVETDSADQEEAALQNLKEVDFVAYTLWKSLRAMLSEYQKLQALGVPGNDRRLQDLEEQLEAMDLTFTVFLSDGQIMELCDGGAEKVVTLDNLEVYLTAVIRARMDESKDVLNIIKQGLNSILPVAALSLYTWKELERRACGVAEVDVNLLKQNTEYDEDVSAQDEFVQRFWRVLASVEEEDKRSFLRFVWARSRLPAGTAQFHQKFKIQSLAPASNGGTANGESSGSSSASGGWMDSQLPKSHTCFFALQLPRYSTDEICRKQMLYAIRNCVEMDGDFRLADTEMTGWNDINPNDQLRF